MSDSSVINTGLPSSIVFQSIGDDDQKILISGKTYKYKDLMKLIGGIWETSKQGWIIDSAKKDEIIEKINDRLKNEQVKKFESKLQRDLQKEDRFRCKPSNGCRCSNRSWKPCKLCINACCSEFFYNVSIDPYYAKCPKHNKQVWWCKD